MCDAWAWGGKEGPRFVKALERIPCEAIIFGFIGDGGETFNGTDLEGVGIESSSSDSTDSFGGIPNLVFSLVNSLRSLQLSRVRSIILFSSAIS